MRSMTLTVLQVLNHPCILGMNPISFLVLAILILSSIKHNKITYTLPTIPRHSVHSSLCTVTHATQSTVQSDKKCRRPYDLTERCTRPSNTVISIPSVIDIENIHTKLLSLKTRLTFPRSMLTNHLICKYVHLLVHTQKDV